MSDEVREFPFRRRGIFNPFWTAIWGLITIYLLWRIYQVLTGALPWWLVFVPIAGLIYVWIVRLAPVKSVTLARDGGVVFDRHVGRSETHAIYVKRVRPWGHGWSGKYFVLRHTQGLELLFEDPERTAEVVWELKRLNPDLEVRGVPALAASQR